MAPQLSKRLYLRNLPKHFGEDVLLKHLSSYGKIVEVKIVHDYAFVQFENEKDAYDVLKTFSRQPLLGRDIVVEFARPLRKDIIQAPGRNSTNLYHNIRPRPAPAHVQSRYPIVVTNIPRKVRWQELKDFGRIPGALVAYCDLDKKKRGRGFIEYFSKEDAEHAAQNLNGRYLGGRRVKVHGRLEELTRDNRGRSRSPGYRYSNLEYCHSSGKDSGGSPVTPSPHNTTRSRYQDHRPYDSSSPIHEYWRSPSHTLHQPKPSSQGYSPVHHDHQQQSQYSAAYPINVQGGDQYDYAGHTTQLDAWKYSYDQDHTFEPGHYDAFERGRGYLEEAEYRGVETSFHYH